MKLFQLFSIVLVFSVVLAASTRTVSTVRAQDGQQPNSVAQLKQIISGQEKRVKSLESRVVKLEETHKILRFDQYVEAAKAANEMGPVQPSGKPVSSKTRLKTGDRVLVEWGDSWWKGQILKVLPDGNVKIHYIGWDAQWDEVAPRTRLQLPEKQTANPKNP